MPQERSLSRAEQALKYVVASMRGDVGRTRLAKLLYMVDHEAHRYLGRGITGLAWKREPYGPFDDTGFYGAARTLQELGLLRYTADTTEFGGRTYLYHDAGGPVGFDFTPGEMRILGYVVAEYGGLSRQELVHDVVYETEPFKAVKDDPEGTPIPFEVVAYERRNALGGIDIEAAIQGGLEIKEGRGIPLREVVGELLR